MVQAELKRTIDNPMSPLAMEVNGALKGIPSAPKPTELVSALGIRLDDLRDRVLPLRGGDGVISFLSDYGVLPSYASPIYVDEMRLYKLPADRPPRSDLRLQRDRRISLVEYMPGRALVAGKSVIRSEGLWSGWEPSCFGTALNEIARSSTSTRERAERARTAGGTELPPPR